MKLRDRRMRTLVALGVLERANAFGISSPATASPARAIEPGSRLKLYDPRRKQTQQVIVTTTKG